MVRAAEKRKQASPPPNETVGSPLLDDSRDLAIEDSQRGRLPLSTSGAVDQEPVLLRRDKDLLQRPNKRRRTQSPVFPVGNIVFAPPPSTSQYLPIAYVRSCWNGEQSLENIVVFGDSYSKSDDGDTWANYLGKQLRGKTIPSEIHIFAFPGATAEYDLSPQLSSFFDVFPQKKGMSNAGPILDPDKSVYILFLGINDCGTTDSDELEEVVEALFDNIHDLYTKGRARNFILIDVPPIDRSPQAIDCENSTDIEERVKTWNELLRTQATEFATSTEQATILLFSSHQVLMEVLDDPSEFHFSENDVECEGGAIWRDELHLSRGVHNILAKHLLASVLPP
ncbi:carbohydrate esterase family 16 protein [Daedalea quercina L-15889]|uniref:Carbohydrate esterase family 16 protein n=1 Tax=Daedalea quercina L-15889 TaxID=1314783 RepID=A0A165TY96_9APHY|nr:carbohydrate esterase family 16 protein [Daedalea quercina L-15889]